MATESTPGDHGRPPDRSDRRTNRAEPGHPGPGAHRGERLQYRAARADGSDPPPCAIPADPRWPVYRPLSAQRQRSTERVVDRAWSHAAYRAHTPVDEQLNALTPMPQF